jgi:hypothetical protein
VKHITIIFWLALVFLLIALGMWGVAALGITWDGWAKSSCWPNCFCEAYLPGGMLQPQSVYSNLYYVLVGLLVIGFARLPASGRNNLMLRRPSYTVGYGLAAIAAGLSSWFYHFSFTQVGRWFDYMGMYAFAGYALLYNLVRLRGWSGKAFAGLYAALLAVWGTVWIIAPDTKRYLFVGLILGMILSEVLVLRLRKPSIQISYFYAALFSFAVAGAANLLDESGMICTPTSWWQWHAFWHFATALAMGLLYLYYRSELSVGE